MLFIVQVLSKTKVYNGLLNILYIKLSSLSSCSEYVLPDECFDGRITTFVPSGFLLSQILYPFGIFLFISTTGLVKRQIVNNSLSVFLFIFSKV